MDEEPANRTQKGCWAIGSFLLAAVIIFVLVMLYRMTTFMKGF
jgi:hypothetical protein